MARAKQAKSDLQVDLAKGSQSHTGRDAEDDDEGALGGRLEPKEDGHAQDGNRGECFEPIDFLSLRPHTASIAMICSHIWMKLTLSVR